MAKPSLSIAIMGKGPASSRPSFPASKPPMGKPASPFGSQDAAPSRAAPSDAKDEMVEAAGEVSIKPEAVCYRTADQVCGSCEYNEAGECKVLKTTVQDGDSCNAFESKGEDAGMEMDTGMGMGAGMGEMRQ